ncbi:MAG: major capsid protein [Microvirus sp.]|nr:MAG: major capsid protein [Microvirus sp.]
MLPKPVILVLFLFQSINSLLVSLFLEYLVVSSFKHNLSNAHHLTCDQGQLVPLFCNEVLPGDVWQQDTSLLIRVAPLLAPVMHECTVRVHHFFVPNRLVWDGWEQFIVDAKDVDTVQVPVLGPCDAKPAGSNFATIVSPGSLADYLGVPAGDYSSYLPAIVPDTPFYVNALPFRGYALIYNEFFRDQDLQAPLPVSTASVSIGFPDTVTNITLANVDWEKDYFTSARPAPQDGDAVFLPLAIPSLPVKGLGVDASATATFNASAYETGSNTARNFATAAGSAGTSPPNGNILVELNGGVSRVNVRTEATNSSTSINLNDLRKASALQRFRENLSRFGSRYSERLRNAFGVSPTDARLQRPEYLGGGKHILSFSEVLQTADAPSTGTYVGTMRGHGISGLRSMRYRRRFEEHGYVFTLLSVRPRTGYLSSIHKHWLRKTTEDFFQPEFQNLGQQAISQQEIYPFAKSSRTTTFGWQDRYDEYRHLENRVSGDFRSKLNFWHMAREFSSPPTLNSSFVTATPTNRIYADTVAPKLLVSAYNKAIVRRKVSYKSNPRLF